MRENYKPPFPAWKAHLPRLCGRVVMAYFGVQAQNTELPPSALEEVTSRFQSPQGPDHWDMASYWDAMKFHNLIAIAYWPSSEKFEKWKQCSTFTQWWGSQKPEKYGFFLEVVTPDPDSLETIFSDRGKREGVAWLAEGMGDEVQEHGYWGSARERLPIARSDALKGTENRQEWKESNKRVIISGRNNLCLIRSGQDWSDTQEEERNKYLHEVEPVLRDGMHFLRDNGSAVGCLSCRYMTVIDPITHAATEKTFGLAHFIDLTSLEGWAKSHPTHVAIFQGFMRYVKELDFKIGLRLWHEIVVVPAGLQHFEYINCHKSTGLLNAVGS